MMYNTLPISNVGKLYWLKLVTGCPLKVKAIFNINFTLLKICQVY